MTEEELEELKESERMQLARALASKACERALREVKREEKSSPVPSIVRPERFVLGKPPPLDLFVQRNVQQRK